jgi:hypothetical protein
MTTATVSAVTTASGAALLIVLVLGLLGAEARRQHLRPQGRGGATVTAALVLLLGADVLSRFVLLAHAH